MSERGSISVFKLVLPRDTNETGPGFIVNRGSKKKKEKKQRDYSIWVDVLFEWGAMPLI